MPGTTTDVLGGSSSLTGEDVIDGLSSNAAMKGPCLCVATTNITLAGEQTIGGIATDESRVLVAGQTDARENGIYVTSTGDWRRAKDFSRTDDCLEGTQVRVTRGVGRGLYVVTTVGPIVFGTSDIDFDTDDAITQLDIPAAVWAWIIDPTSAKLATAVSGETGTAGGLVFSESPTFTTRITLSGAELDQMTIDTALSVGGDYLGNFSLRGRSSTGVEKYLGGLYGFYNDHTQGSEDTQVLIDTRTAGVITDIASFAGDFIWLYSPVNIISNPNNGRSAWPSSDFNYIEGTADLSTGWVIASYGSSGLARIYGRKAFGTNNFSAAQVTGSGSMLSLMGIARDNSGSWDQSGSVEIQLRHDATHTTTSHETSIQFRTTPSGSTTLTTQMTVESSGRVTFSAGQLGFPATKNGSSGANDLDDYEEGTFTVTPAASGATFSIASRTGRYTVIGDVCFIKACDFALNTSGNTLTANALTLTGLPFASNASDGLGCFPVRYAAATTSYYSITARIAAGSSTVTLEGVTAAGVANTTAVLSNGALHATNGSAMQMKMFYGV
jgi:hypothetical protein